MIRSIEEIAAQFGGRPEEIGVCCGCEEPLGKIDGTRAKAICRDCARWEWAMDCAARRLRFALRESFRDVAHEIAAELRRERRAPETVPARKASLWERLRRRGRARR